MTWRAAAAALMILLAPLLAAAQHRARGPHRAAGHPDLQGVWDNSTLTPLERPAALADEEFFPDKAAADYESLEQYIVRLQARSGDAERAVTGEANGIWRTGRSLGPDRRTSVIVDPSVSRRCTRTVPVSPSSIATIRGVGSAPNRSVFFSNSTSINCRHSERSRGIPPRYPMLSPRGTSASGLG